MSLTLVNLQERRKSLAISIQASEELLKDLKERMKVVKKEITNGVGAIIELDRLMESL